MNWRTYLIPAALLLLGVAGYRAYGWQGVLMVTGGLLMWALLHYTRLVNVMQRAARNPVGTVGSAVMLNAKLRPGVNLLHVVALTRSLGKQLSPQGQQPELYQWTDGTDSVVTCEFAHGRLQAWQLQRPQAQEPAQEPESGAADHAKP